MTWKSDIPYQELPLLPPSGVELETKKVLKAVTEARAELARLDQATALMPDPTVLINAIPLLEAQASSEIENIVTTTDALFEAASGSDDNYFDPAVKETLRYRTALKFGFESLLEKPLSTATAKQICSGIKGVDMDLRSVPGTRIANPDTEEIIYSPPEGRDVLIEKLNNWEKFVHAEDGLDPLVTMAVAHYQFEAIHPFADGNGRTGRILNILLLHQAGLLQLPVLYISRYIIKHKNDYYRLLREVTSEGNWEDWVIYMVEAVRLSAQSTVHKIRAIHELQESFKINYEDVTKGMRDSRFLDTLFNQPYVRIGNVVDECGVSRQTASGWLDALAQAGVLRDVKRGRDRLFVNTQYLKLLTRTEPVDN